MHARMHARVGADTHKYTHYPTTRKLNSDVLYKLTHIHTHTRMFTQARMQVRPNDTFFVPTLLSSFFLKQLAI